MDKELETVVEQFRQNILNKIDLMNDKIVVFDLDGVLCKFKYTNDEDDRLLPCIDKPEIVNGFSETNDYYKFGIPVALMQYIISNLNIENVYILSMTAENVRKWKSNWIDKNYPEIKKDNIIYTYTVDEKIGYLKDLKSRFSDKSIIFVEDRAETLIQVNEEGLDVKCIHISNFLG